MSFLTLGTFLLWGILLKLYIERAQRQFLATAVLYKTIFAVLPLRRYFVHAN